jgi:hypothetical protein
MSNFVQTTPFVHVPLAQFEAAVAFFGDLLGFTEIVHVQDYAYVEREGCGMRIWGREDAADTPRGIGNFR